MREILPNIYHWTTFHEGIQEIVHSYYVMKPHSSFVIDPRVPKQGLSWFKKHNPPKNIYLTNRLHFRHSADFKFEFNSNIWCHQKGLAHFDKKQHVLGFKHKQRLPGGVIALNINTLCPEETVLFIPLEGGILSIADSIIHKHGKLLFVNDELLGDNPEQIKKGIKMQFRQLLRRQFKHLFFAHGQPIIGKGKTMLKKFIN